MFYYLLARNCNMKKNAEEIASISALKYIGLMIAVRFIEYKYLESGFFNYYILAFMTFDIIFSLYRYKKVAEKESRDIDYYTDDVIDDDFLMDDYIEEINDIKTGFLKRKYTENKIYHHNINKDADNYNENYNENNNTIVEETITSEPVNIIDVNNIPQFTPSNCDDISHNINIDISHTSITDSLKSNEKENNINSIN